MSAVDLILFESFPIDVGAPSDDAPGDPIVRLAACPQTIRLRRDLAAAAPRSWRLELEVEVHVPDPEQTLVDCHGFVVDTTDGEALGVVDEVEVTGEGDLALAVVVASGQLGRSRVRVDAEQIEIVAPAERRLVVRRPARGSQQPERQG